MSAKETLAVLAARSVPEPNTGCRLWLGELNWDGYPRMYLAGKKVRVHRVAYELERGPIPEGLQLDHLCRVRSCINPAHLEPVTLKENLLRGVGFPARNVNKTVCLRGHPLSGENLLLAPNVPGKERAAFRRVCRACRKLNEKKRRDGRRKKWAANSAAINRRRRDLYALKRGGRE